VNVSSHETRASASHLGLDSAGSELRINAHREGFIASAGVGGAGSGKIAAGFGVGANVIADTVSADGEDLHAREDDEQPVVADELTITADHGAAIWSLAGGAAGAGTAAGGAGITANWSDATVAAELADSHLAIADQTTVSAATDGTIGSLGFGLAASGKVSLGGGLTFNGIDNDVTAGMVDTSQADLDNTLLVQASDDADIWSAAVAAAVSGNAAGALAMAG